MLLLQQSGAADWDDALVRGLLDDALRVVPPTVTLPHSGRTLHRGEPVHPQRPEHPLFRTPHALDDASWWQGWSLLEPWEPKAAQPAGGRRPPHTSPMSAALPLDVSSAAPDAIAANTAALRRMQPLLTHAMGSAGLVLAEVFSPPPPFFFSGSTRVSNRDTFCTKHTASSVLLLLKVDAAFLRLQPYSLGVAQEYVRTLLARARWNWIIGAFWQCTG